MTINELDGFFAALHCGPELVPLHKLIPEIMGAGATMEEDAFTDIDQLNTFMALVFELWNNVSDRLHKDQAFLPYLLDTDTSEHEWSIGFLRGMSYFAGDWLQFLKDEKIGGACLAIFAFANEFNPDTTLRPYDDAITQEQRRTLTVYLCAGVTHIFNYFTPQRNASKLNTRSSLTPIRTLQKLGRNQACFCGSGKKYKKCCLKSTDFE